MAGDPNSTPCDAVIERHHSFLHPHPDVRLIVYKYIFKDFKTYYDSLEHTVLCNSHGARFPFQIGNSLIREEAIPVLSAALQLCFDWPKCNGRYVRGPHIRFGCHKCTPGFKLVQKAGDGQLERTVISQYYLASVKRITVLVNHLEHVPLQKVPTLEVVSTFRQGRKTRETKTRVSWRT